MAKKVYMHLINGQPGVFFKGQIWYASKDYFDRTGGFLKASLKEIKSERKKSEDFRKKHGWDVSKYGYIGFYLEEPAHD